MPGTAGSEAAPNAGAKRFTSGRSHAVRLPREFRFKEEDGVILEFPHGLSMTSRRGGTRYPPHRGSHHEPR